MVGEGRPVKVGKSDVREADLVRKLRSVFLGFEAVFEKRPFLFQAAIVVDDPRDLFPAFRLRGVGLEGGQNLIIDFLGGEDHFFRGGEFDLAGMNRGEL